MKKFEMYLPTQVVFGPGAESEAGSLCKKLGANKVFIVYGGGSAVKSGLIGRVEDSLKAAGLDYDKMGGVVANPLLSKAEEIRDAAKAFGADFILGVGGGSVLDTAKAVAHSIANPDATIWELFTGKKKVVKTTPVGAILTISAAGSEMSNSAVLTNDLEEPVIKTGLTEELNRPVFAILDPELTYTLPKYQIAAGVADIFLHTAERYWCDNTLMGNHLTDEIAEGLFRNIMKYGPIGVNDPTNYEAMSEIMWSGSVSHNGLTGLGCKGDTPREGDWGVHQLGMAISALYNSTHGATLAATWASWARYVYKTNVARFAQYARNVFGIEGTDEECALAGIAKTEEWFSLIDMPISLTQLLDREITDEIIIGLTDNCSRNHGRTIGSFKVLDYDDMKKIYEAAR